MGRLLLVEDDAALADGLGYALGKNGFQTDAVRTKREMLSRLPEIGQYDLVILDVTLPDGNGFEICGWIRQKDTRIPIIFLTASDEEVSVIRGLDCGGDDYVTKPFKLGELCSRIHALLRRAGRSDMERGNILNCGAFSVDFSACAVLKNGKRLELTSGEYRLLCLLMKNKECVLSRAAILDELWDAGGHFVDDNTLSVYIRRLREKVEEDASNPRYLVTVRGIGYQWKEAGR